MALDNCSHKRGRAWGRLRRRGGTPPPLFADSFRQRGARRSAPGAGWQHTLQATIYGDQVSALVSVVSVDTRANAKSLSLSGLSRLSGLSSKPGLASQPVLLRSSTSLAAVATWRRLHGRQTFRVFRGWQCRKASVVTSASKFGIIVANETDRHGHPRFPQSEGELPLIR